MQYNTTYLIYLDKEYITGLPEGGAEIHRLLRDKYGESNVYRLNSSNSWLLKTQGATISSIANHIGMTNAKQRVGFIVALGTYTGWYKADIWDFLATPVTQDESLNPASANNLDTELANHNTH